MTDLGSRNLAPSTSEEFKEWKAWASACAKAKRWPANAPATAWRAIIADWGGFSVDPQDACKAALRVLVHGAKAPAYVVRAAVMLARECIEQGATSSDVLYLVAAVA